MGIHKLSKVSTFLVGIMMIAILLCCSTHVQAAQEGDYTYTVTDGEAQITGYTGAGGDVTIPSTLGGATVTSIGDEAFLGTSITSISIPDGVTSIGDEAFFDCTGLNSITFNSATTTIFDNAYTIPSATKIIGHDPSTAKDYAAKYGQPFEVIGSTSPVTVKGTISLPSGVTWPEGYSISIFYKANSMSGSAKAGNILCPAGENTVSFDFDLPQITDGYKMKVQSGSNTDLTNTDILREYYLAPNTGVTPNGYAVQWGEAPLFGQSPGIATVEVSLPQVFCLSGKISLPAGVTADKDFYPSVAAVDITTGRTLSMTDGYSHFAAGTQSLNYVLSVPVGSEDCAVVAHMSKYTLIQGVTYTDSYYNASGSVSRLDIATHLNRAAGTQSNIDISLVPAGNTNDTLIIHGITEGAIVSQKTNLTASVNGAELIKVYYYLVDQAQNQYNIGESYNTADNWRVEFEPAKYNAGAYQLAAVGIRKDTGESIYAQTINITTMSVSGNMNIMLKAKMDLVIYKDKNPTITPTIINSDGTVQPNANYNFGFFIDGDESGKWKSGLSWDVSGTVPGSHTVTVVAIDKTSNKRFYTGAIAVKVRQLPKVSVKMDQEVQKIGGKLSLQPVVTVGLADNELNYRLKGFYIDQKSNWVDWNNSKYIDPDKTAGGLAVGKHTVVFVIAHSSTGREFYSPEYTFTVTEALTNTDFILDVGFDASRVPINPDIVIWTPWTPQWVLPGSMFNNISLSSADGKKVPIVLDYKNDYATRVILQEDLDYNCQYTLKVPAGAFEDFSGKVISSWEAAFTTAPLRIEFPNQVVIGEQNKLTVTGGKLSYFFDDIPGVTISEWSKTGDYSVYGPKHEGQYTLKVTDAEGHTASAKFTAVFAERPLAEKAGKLLKNLVDSGQARLIYKPLVNGKYYAVISIPGKYLNSNVELAALPGNHDLNNKWVFAANSYYFCTLDSNKEVSYLVQDPDILKKLQIIHNANYEYCVKDRLIKYNTDYLQHSIDNINQRKKIYQDLKAWELSKDIVAKTAGVALGTAINVSVTGGTGPAVAVQGIADEVKGMLTKAVSNPKVLLDVVACGVEDVSIDAAGKLQKIHKEIGTYDTNGKGFIINLKQAEDYLNYSRYLMYDGATSELRYALNECDRDVVDLLNDWFTSVGCSALSTAAGGLDNLPNEIENAKAITKTVKTIVYTSNALKWAEKGKDIFDAVALDLGLGEHTAVKDWYETNNIVKNRYMHLLDGDPSRTYNYNLLKECNNGLGEPMTT